MKKLIFIFTILLLLFVVSKTCGETTTNAKETSNTKSTSISNLDSDNTDAMIDFSNPEYMAGSDFGNYFKLLKVQGDYENMIAFTSDESIEKYGEDNIIQHYKEMEFGYDLDLKKSVDKDSITTLNYLGSIRATNMSVSMDVVVENDSCKLYIGDNIENAIKVDKDL